jgi:endonuclease/exonuclease/phosphatase family metal-dependent hydrolase
MREEGARAGPDSVPTFGVLTLNIWNINPPLELRFSALVEGLARLRPDIVCLQEASIEPRETRSQAEQVAARAGYAHHLELKDLAILSRHPIIQSRIASLPEFPGDGPRQVLMAEIRVGDDALIVANTHLAYPPAMTRERLAQVEVLLAALSRYCASIGVDTAVLCGDFNDVPDSPAIRRILDRATGFHDTYADCHSGMPGFTYARGNRYVDPSTAIDQRIDYIFVSRDLESKACAVVFDGGGGLGIASDHYGVFCDLSRRRDEA